MKISVTIILCCICSIAFSQQPELVIPTGHSEVITGLTYSPGGHYLLSRSKNEIILWDAALARQIRKFNTTENSIAGLQFHPDGNYFITYRKDGQQYRVLVWDLTKVDPVRSIDINKDEPRNILFTTDGKYLIVQGFFDIQLYNFSNAQLEKKISFLDYKSAITAIASTNNSQQLLVGLTNNKIIVWDLAAGKSIRTFEGHDIKTDLNKGISSIILLPDDNHVFSVSAPAFEEVLIMTWDINSGTIVHQSRVKDISKFSSSKDRSLTLLRNNKQQTYLINTLTGSVVDSIAGLGDLELHPNNQYVATGDYRDIKIISLKTKKTSAILNGCSVSLSNIWISKQKNVYATSIYNVLAYKSDNITRLPLQRRFDYGKYFPTRNDDILLEQKVIRDDNTNNPVFHFFDLYDQSKGMITAEYKTKFNPSIELRDIATMSGVVKYLLLYDFSKSYQNSKEFYQLYNLEEDRIEKEFSYVKRNGFDPNPLFRFTADGQNIISANYDLPGQLHQWKTSSFKPNKLINEGYQKFGKITSIEITPDGKYLISATEDKHLTIFSFLKGQIELVKDWTDFDIPVDLIRITNNNRYLFAASGNAIFVYDLQSLSMITCLKGHKANIADVRYLEDFDLFLSTATDNTSRFWDLKGKELASLVYLDLSKEDKSNDFIIVTPEGYFDGTSDAIKKLHLVNGLTIYPLDALFEKFYTPGLADFILSNQPVSLVRKDITKSVESSSIPISSLYPPPVVEVLSPQDQFNSNTPSVEIKVKILDTGGGIDEVLLYQNGKLIEGSERGFKKVEEKSKEVNKSFTINLLNGKNIIRATAFNLQRTESNPFEIVITYEADKPKMNLYLLAVGLNSYKNAAYNLNYAIPDANAFVDIINQNAETIFSKVNITYIKDLEATRENILKEFNSIKQNAMANDVFLFYYAGHGVMSEEDKPQFYLAPYNVTKLYGDQEELTRNAISAAELHTLSKEIKAQKQLFILDACQSGGMVEMLAQRGAAEEKAIAQLARSTGTYWFTASGSDQFATEFKELGHGVFTYGLIEGLSSKADGGEKDKKITVKELSAYLEDLIPELTQRYHGKSQYPRLYGFGQDFPIVIVK